MKIITNSLKGIYFSVFGALACFFPFLSYFFQEKGLTYTQIGFVFAVVSVTGIIVQPIWGYVTDLFGDQKKTLMLSMLMSGITIYGMTIATNFTWILVSVVLFFSFQSAIITLMDAFCYEIIAQHAQIQYGKVRFLGSVGYATMAFICGQIVKNLGVSSGFIAYSLMVVVGLVFVYLIKFKGTRHKTKIQLSDIGTQLKDLRFMVFLLAIGLANVALGSNNSFIPFLMKETGGDVAMLGMLGVVVALSEYPSLTFGNKLLSKFGELNLLMVGMAFYVIRYLLNSVSTTYIMVLAIQSMQSVTYPLFLIASYQYVQRITPVNMRTTAMMIFAAVCGLGGLIGNIGSGILLESISIFALYKVFALICFLTLGAVFVLKNVDRLAD